ARMFTQVGLPQFAVIVVILVIALIALRHPQGHGAQAGSATHTPTSTHASTSRAATPTATSTAPHASGSTSSSTSATTTTPGKLPLVVLNNTTVQGLAQQAKATFEAGGWTVTSLGNYQNDIISTCAYYDPSVTGALDAATALQAQFPAIKRVRPKFAGLPGGPVVVVLTPDYTSG
ncbi:MAG: glycoprotein, partial [Pseudonocardiales bacterium]|nr:glycoprotein [Pseudonocardiales bacterium]